MIILIDNYDSFTYNLVQYLGEMGEDVRVFRNDEITVAEVAAMKPDRIVISPGPGVPDEAGISKELIRTLGPTTPILGVCLGHQCIGEVYGNKVIRAPRLMHGKTSPIRHGRSGLFTGIPDNFNATRYHSLIVEEPLAPVLQATAFTREGELMAMKHREHPIYGVQFHPEAILTEYGKELLQNFCRM